eukprot:4852663-Prymnesium_polylepis.1
MAHPLSLAGKTGYAGRPLTAAQHTPSDAPLRSASSPRRSTRSGDVNLHTALHVGRGSVLHYFNSTSVSCTSKVSWNGDGPCQTSNAPHPHRTNRGSRGRLQLRIQHSTEERVIFAYATGLAAACTQASAETTCQDKPTR